MLDRQTLLSGGLKHLSGEAMPSVAAAADLFENAPDNAVMAKLTLRDGNITVTFDGATDPTAGDVGQDYEPQTLPYEFWMQGQRLRLIKAIDNGGTATGYIDYFGLAG